MKDKIELFFDSYSSQFREKNNKELLKHFSFPLLICHRGETKCFLNPEDLDLGLLKLKEIYSNKEISNYKYDISKLYCLSESYFLTSVDWSFEDCMGKVISSFQCHYNLYYIDDNINIAMVVNQNEVL